MKKQTKIIWPDYENCIANLPNSILKKWRIQTVGGTLPLADKYLEKDHKNVVILLLDGMGKFILEESLDEKGAFRSRLAGSYSSVFLSTTVAATTSVLSGQQPCEHCWLGWDCYYPQIDKNVTIFSNTVQGTEEPAADYHVARKYAPYVDIIERINAAGGKAYYSIPYIPPYPNSFEAVCDHVKGLCKESGKKFIYAYWDQPDGILHRYGRRSPEVVNELKRMEAYVAGMVKELDDTLLFITADHGHINAESVVLQDYPVIMDRLERLPSFESRVLNLFVKEDKKDIFVKEFQKEFADKFMLMTSEEVIEKKLFGTGKEHEIFRSMLGNYLAIAIDDLAIHFSGKRWSSLHGGLTEDEMLIPLIVFD